MSETLPSPSLPPSIALIPYYGACVHEHYLSVRKSKIRFTSTSAAAIDWARSVLVETALRQEDVEVMVFIDADVIFSRESYDQLVQSVSETEGIVGVPYLSKSLTGTGMIVGNVKELPTKLKFYEQGARYPAKTLGMGFTGIHRKAIEQITRHSKMAKAFFHTTGGNALHAYPLFMPMVRDHHYVQEDYAFCLRASDAGVPIHLDTRPEILHRGAHSYRLEDALYLSKKDPNLEIEISG